MTLSAGTRVGPYEIVAPIGAGGMGEVYRARDTRLNRDVALKVLPALVASDPDRLARFHREAQALATLNHPNIAQIHGVEDAPSTHSAQAGVHALVMELVQGPTLADRIDAGPMPLAEALPIARQIAEALEAAHEKGIVHRDLKPANVKVREDGTVKVLDFGLAKVLDPTTTSGVDLANSPTLTARSTQLGMILGTAAYMAPEQAKGKSVDRRADIWAFGVVLFEMLTAQRAFKGDDVSDVLASVLRQDIDWRALPADTPPKIRRLLERCLERDPKRRLRDIGDAWIELTAPDEPAQAPAQSPAPPVSATRRLGRWLPWAVAILAAAGSAAAMYLRAPVAEPGVVVRSTMHSSDLNLLVSLSRDGTRLAFTMGGSSSSSLGIGLRRLDEFEGKVIAGTEGGVLPLFSPDAQWIAFNPLSENKIKKIPVTGGTATTLCDGSFLGGAAWGDDDTIIFSGPSGLMRVPAAGGTPQQVTTVDKAKGETGHTRPQFLPGGKQVLFTVASSNPEAGRKFAVLDLTAGTFRAVANGGLNGKYLATGHLAYVRGSTLFAVPFDLARLQVAGAEAPVVERVSLLGPGDTADYAVSDNGLLAYVQAEEGNGTTVAWADRTGKATPLPGQSHLLWGTGRLSPDGHRLANGIHAESDKSDIWVLDVDRGTPTRLTFDGGSDYPIWTPDNRRIVFSGTTAGAVGLYSVPADGSARATLVLATSATAQPTSFSPDGRTLMYTQPGTEKRRQIMVLPFSADGRPGQPHPLHEASAAEADGQISPDGKWVAYTSNEAGTAEIYVQAFPGPGAKTRVSATGGTFARWFRDGRRLFYWASLPSSALMEVDVTPGQTMQLGAAREVFRMFSGTTWDVTPDANRFLVEMTSTGNGSTIALVTNWFAELRQRAPAKK